MADDVLAWAVAALRDADRNRRYALVDRYYRGDQDLAFATPKFESAFGRLFEAFAYNRCAAVVDAHADRLHVEGFAATDPSHGEAAKRIWDRNRMDKRQGQLYTESLTSGDGYLLVWPDERTGLSTLWPQRAVNVRVRYDDEQPGRVVAAAKAWTKRDGRVRLNTYEPEKIRRFVARAKTAAASGVPVAASSFAAFDEDGGAAEFENPYRVVPIVPFPNNASITEEGVSELRVVVPEQDALNYTLTAMMVAIELAAVSQKVILGLDNPPPVIDPITGGLVIDPATGLPVDPMAGPLAKFQFGVDRILTISGKDAKVAEFSPANLAQFLAVAEFFDTTVSRVSKVPVHYLSLSGGFPSGRALRTAEAPFVAKLEDRQRALGNGVEDALSLALRIDGVAEPDGGFGLSTLWRSAAPMSAEDDWDLALQKVGVGLPLEQVLRELGYDEDTLQTVLGIVDGERTKLAEREDAALMRVVDRQDGADDAERMA